MKTGWTISLSGVKVRAFHGVHSFEKEKGNDFIVSVKVKPHPEELHVGNLDSTIDYENLYKIILEEMQVTSGLMEEVAKRIGEKIFSEHAICQELEISISKLVPETMPGVGEANVTLSLSR